MEHRLHNVVMARLDAIANAEKITRAELGHLSREALIYVMDTQDIDFINRLLGVLTKVNRKACIEYFTMFLPWEHENDKEGNFQRFGKKMLGEKKLAKRRAAMDAWLAVETNDLWVWVDLHLTVETKKPDFKARVSSSIKKALEGDEEKDAPPLTALELLVAIFDGGFKLEDMLSASNVWADARAAAEKEALALMGENIPEENQGIAA